MTPETLRTGIGALDWAAGGLPIGYLTNVVVSDPYLPGRLLERLGHPPVKSYDALVSALATIPKLLVLSGWQFESDTSYVALSRVAHVFKFPVLIVTPENPCKTLKYHSWLRIALKSDEQGLWAKCVKNSLAATQGMTVSLDPQFNVDKLVSYWPFPEVL